MSPSLPSPPDSVITAIRCSCAALTTRSEIIINDDAIDSFLIQIGPTKWNDNLNTLNHGLRLPLRFESAEEELNVVSVLSILNFLSGYRTPLHRLTTRGAWSTILAFVLSAHLSSSDTSSPSLLSTRGMCSANLALVSSMCQIPTHQEKPHPTLGPAVTVGEKDDDAFEIVGLIVKVLNETGEVLKKQGMKDLGAWVKHALIETDGDCEQMIRKLYEAFPGFQDAYIIDGEHVYVLKKIFFLLNGISLRFAPSASPEHAPTFPLPKRTNELPIFADNVIPSMLLHFGIISLTPSLALPPSPPLLSTEHMTRIRAASITACKRMVERANELARTDTAYEWMQDMLEIDLDCYLWELGKKPEGKDVTRLAERGTVMY